MWHARCVACACDAPPSTHLEASACRLRRQAQLLGQIHANPASGTGTQVRGRGAPGLPGTCQHAADKRCLARPVRPPVPAAVPVDASLQHSSAWLRIPPSLHAPVVKAAVKLLRLGQQLRQIGSLRPLHRPLRRRRCCRLRLLIVVSAGRVHGRSVVWRCKRGGAWHAAVSTLGQAAQQLR